MRCAVSCISAIKTTVGCLPRGRFLVVVVVV